MNSRRRSRWGLPAMLVLLVTPAGAACAADGEVTFGTIGGPDPGSQVRGVSAISRTVPPRVVRRSGHPPERALRAVRHGRVPERPVDHPPVSAAALDRRDRLRPHAAQLQLHSADALCGNRARRTRAPGYAPEAHPGRSRQSGYEHASGHGRATADVFRSLPDRPHERG